MNNYHYEIILPDPPHSTLRTGRVTAASAWHAAVEAANMKGQTFAVDIGCTIKIRYNALDEVDYEEAVAMDQIMSAAYRVTKGLDGNLTVQLLESERE